VYVIVWTFEARAGRETEFERAYGAAGDWAQLFGTSPGFRGSELLRDSERRRHYSTIDRWASRQAFDEFRRDRAADYDALDARCAALTVSERLVGRFEAT